MSCTSCTIGTTKTTSGCNNNGICGTTGCNKKNSFDWLIDLDIPEFGFFYPVVEVSFKGGRKGFFSNPDGYELYNGEPVIVEVPGGHDLGYVTLKGELVRAQMKKYKVDEKEVLKKIYRPANKNDIEKWESVKELETSSLPLVRGLSIEAGLDMKISDLEYQADKRKVTIYYSSEDRVDFRDLIRKLNEKLGVKIEMKQISLRQEAGRIGGFGSCGRELCCSTWITDFKSVSTNAARYQNLSINPAKLQGQCGRLKCCLNFELDQYMEVLKDIPVIEENLKIEQGVLRFIKTDIFRRLMWFYLNDDSDWNMLTVTQVVEIIESNKKGIFPKINLENEKETKGQEFKFGTGEELSLTRLDRKRGWGR